MTLKTVFDLTEAALPVADADFLLVAQNNVITRVTFTNLMLRPLTATTLTATGATSLQALTVAGSSSMQGVSLTTLTATGASSLQGTTVTTFSATGAATLTAAGNKLAVSGTGSTFAVNPAAAGSLNNTVIGGTTAAQGPFTSLTATGSTSLQGTTVTTLSATGAALFNTTQTIGLSTHDQPAAATQNTAATLTLAQIQARVLTSAPAAAITLTFPTGATLDGFITDFQNDTGFDFSIVNTAAQTITLAGNTGATYTGNTTLAANTSASFRFRRVSAGSYQIFRV